MKRNAAEDDQKDNAGVDQEIYAKRRKLNDISLLKLIPPKGQQRQQGDTQQLDTVVHHVVESGDSMQGSLIDWSTVISRAKSHPQEAAESYFGPSHVDDHAITDVTTTNKSSIITYKPLHAMLEYDPPLEAVEAVLRAHPEAALDITFEGTALKIACESRVSSMLVLRLLLIAEMAMRKKMQLQEEQEQRQIFALAQSAQQGGVVTGEEIAQNSLLMRSDDQSRAQSEQQPPYTPQNAQQNMFIGHNPITWVIGQSIPVKTAATLLKWYPIGAFQRPWDLSLDMDHNHNELESPLIEMVDAFARDHYDEMVAGGLDTDQTTAGSEYLYDSKDDFDYPPSTLPEQRTPTTAATGQRQLQREQRWQKFLHILYATDLVLQSTTRRRPSVTERSSPPPTSPVGASCTATAAAAAASLLRAHSSEDQSEVSPQATESPSITPFRPVHAWIRCLTSPFLGLEHCRPYGVWSILRVMSQRMPSEFTVRDMSDGNRTSFQTLAESSATDCKLCSEEVKDILECLLDSDYRSAFL